MNVIEGTAISGSIFIGRVKVYKNRQYPSFPKTINQAQVKTELTKIKQAIDQLQETLQTLLVDPGISQLDKDILNTHLMIVTDIEIAQILETSIVSDLYSAPQAILVTFEKIVHNFEELNNAYFAQRSDDYKDVAHRLMITVLGDKDHPKIKYGSDDIIILSEITPSLVTTFAKSGVKAYCTEHGSYTSHSAILARAFGMTAMVSKTPLLHSVKDGTTAILDTAQGKIIISPDADQTELYQKQLALQHEITNKLNAELALPAQTQNGVTISIKANIEYPGELDNVFANYCEGIGLFRTEFIYLNRNTMPEEAEQTKIYADLIDKLNGLPVIIRTFDLGGDKISFLQKYKREENPYLGSRGIRFSLQENSLFKTQIRSILKASTHGKVSIMFPMIISSEDFLAGRALVKKCMQELDNEGLQYDKDIQIGAMIETPSAALCAEQLAKVCDFFSLGTNDLVQYTLAVDRNNDQVAPYYIQHHPAVLMLINKTIQAAHKAGIPVSICGEMASTLKYVPLLIGMGITEISINPSKAAEVKAVIRKCDDNLYHIIQNFDFNSPLTHIETLINETLLKYHSLTS